MRLEVVTRIDDEDEDERREDIAKDESRSQVQKHAKLKSKSKRVEIKRETSIRKERDSERRITDGVLFLRILASC